MLRGHLHHKLSNFGEPMQEKVLLIGVKWLHEKQGCTGGDAALLGGVTPVGLDLQGFVQKIARDWED